MDEKGERTKSPAQQPDDVGPSLERTAKAFQENVNRSAPVAGASYGLIGGIIVLGLIGYAVDRWQGTGPWFLLGGLLLGLIVGFYGLAKVVWRR